MASPDLFTLLVDAETNITEAGLRIQDITTDDIIVRRIQQVYGKVFEDQTTGRRDITLDYLLTVEADAGTVEAYAEQVDALEGIDVVAKLRHRDNPRMIQQVDPQIRNLAGTLCTVLVDAENGVHTVGAQISLIRMEHLLVHQIQQVEGRVKSELTDGHRDITPDFIVELWALGPQFTRLYTGLLRSLRGVEVIGWVRHVGNPLLEI